MNPLPPELVHMICKLLPVDSIPSFRLVHPVWADVGLHYMIPEVHIVLLPSSLARLQAIAQHPVLRQYVYSVVYEANMLPKFKNATQWNRRALGGIDLPEEPPPGASERDMRAYNRALDKARSENIPRSEVLPAWRAYRDLYKSQQMLRKSGEDFTIIQDAMAQFPRLATVEMLSLRPPRCPCEMNYPSPHSLNAYADGLIHPALLPGLGLSDGIRETKTLLVGAALANSKLTTLELHNLCWEFFTWEIIWRPDEVRQMKEILHSIRKLTITINLMGYDEVEDYPFVQEGLADLVGHATSLETLRVQFEHWEEEWTDISDVLERCNSPSLKSLAAAEFQVTKSSLLKFFERHSETLKQICMRNSELWGGNWGDIFMQMPILLDLDEVKIRGVFANLVDGNFANMDRLAFESAAEILGVDQIGQLPPNYSLRDRFEDLLYRRNHEGPKAAEDLKGFLQLIDLMD
ncbi:MAG: hypothetical protein MMC33_009124 [Icmadophila ericetorum]|nr:hypothetical protein [Icmadophila ericetorum]